MIKNFRSFKRQNDMGDVKKYGQPPYSVVLLHGGPGAPGEMAPVAKYLSAKYAVLEPYQSKDSIAGQVEELKAQLDSCAAYPVTLVGYSWGAWLAWIFAAKYPKIVIKIILVSSAPFEDSYAAVINKTRLSRLNRAERQEAEFLLENMNNPAVRDKFKLMKRIAEIVSKSDSFNPDFKLKAEAFIWPEIYDQIWAEAGPLRKSGELLGLSKKIKCTVSAIHGDYDPHPADGVKIPISKVKRKFNFILLKNCGHIPWIEKQAMDEFYRALENEIGEFVR
jgi:pimeloyl-ACP methyl ester carboxylesterase